MARNRGKAVEGQDRTTQMEREGCEIGTRAHWAISGCSEHLSLSISYSCVGKNRGRSQGKEDRKQAQVTSLHSHR